MARTKDQAARRQQLVSATIELIADHGIEALTLAAIADRVGVSHRLVAYYYADLESLVHEAHEAAAERYYWARLQALDQAAGPEQRLLQLIALRAAEAAGPPAEPGAQRAERQRQPQPRCTPGWWRSCSTARSRSTSRSSQDGEAGGVFRLSQPALTIARNLVALEDAYGFHLLARTSPVDAATALDALTSYARTATGAALLSPA